MPDALTLAGALTSYGQADEEGVMVRVSRQACDEGAALLRSQHAEIERMQKALKRIARWEGEFPATGRFWDAGTPMSYGAVYGAHGERDYMRQVAKSALPATDKTEESHHE